MAKNNGMEGNKKAEKTKTTTHTRNKHTSIGKKCNWKGVFESVTYSSGPGDNIYVFG
ncbi:MAG: hypothetical protein RQ760_12460 [Sedimentisphaerales bacterium]|nr:hypothetical protein [Sedimentisphaerales bacterium]